MGIAFDDGFASFARCRHIFVSGRSLVSRFGHDDAPVSIEDFIVEPGQTTDKRLRQKYDQGNQT